MSDSDKPVVLASFVDEMTAQLLLNFLVDRGIKATCAGGHIAGFRAEVPSEVRVLVSSRDLDKAQALFSNFRENEAVEIDWDQVDVGDPED